MATHSLASSSAGTLDVPSLVSQLMSLERRPIIKLDTRIASYETKISSFGTLKGLVAGFQTALQSLHSNLQGFSAISSDVSVFSASATSTAAAGTYSLNITALAQAHKLAAAGQALDTSPISAIAPVASTVTFTVGSTSTDVTIAAGATLQNIRATINAANIGVTATIINDGSGTPYRLALSSDNTGTSNAINSITIKLGGDAKINDLLAYNPSENAPAPVVPMAQTVAAQNASFTVNGIAISKTSNTVTDAIQGVTLTLNKLTTSASLTVARDTAALGKAASGFVDAYNALISQLKSRSAYGHGSTSAGALAGDGTVRLMQDQLRGIFGTNASGGILTSLSQVGISTQIGGTLKLDSSKLNSEITNNFSDVTNLFSSATGFATRLNAWSTSALTAGGVFDSRTQSLTKSIKSYNDEISRLEVRMTALQKLYTAQYSNLNMMRTGVLYESRSPVGAISAAHCTGCPANMRRNARWLLRPRAGFCMSPARSYSFNVKLAQRDCPHTLGGGLGWGKWSWQVSLSGVARLP